jgi:hypothetical protein
LIVFTLIHYYLFNLFIFGPRDGHFRSANHHKSSLPRRSSHAALKVSSKLKAKARKAKKEKLAAREASRLR